MCQQVGWVVSLEKSVTSPTSGRLGPAHTGPVAKPSRENTNTAVTTGLSSLAVHALDRFTNGHREKSLPWQIAHETVHLKNNRKKKKK